MEIAEQTFPDRDSLYAQAAGEFRLPLGRLAAAYELELTRQQDLLQELHFAIWRSLAGFRGQCSLRTWVYRVAHNAAATYVRQQRRARRIRCVNIEDIDEPADGSSVESSVDEGRIQSIWQAQPVQTAAVTPQQMRARATRFETQANRRNRIDLLSFALLLLLGIGGVAITGNALVRAGVALLALWALAGLYGVRRFHSLAGPGSPESFGATGAAWYLQQLERQRDVALSRPWGFALAAPGICLMLIGYVDAGAPRDVVAVLGALVAFAVVAVVIHGRILAGRWQHEIDLLRAAQREWQVGS